MYRAKADRSLFIRHRGLQTLDRMRRAETEGRGYAAVPERRHPGKVCIRVFGPNGENLGYL